MTMLLDNCGSKDAAGGTTCLSVKGNHLAALEPGYSGMNRLFVNFQKDSRTNPEYVTAGVRKRRKNGKPAGGKSYRDRAVKKSD